MWVNVARPILAFKDVFPIPPRILDILNREKRAGAVFPEESIKIHVLYLRIHEIVLLTLRCSSNNKPGTVKVKGQVSDVPRLCRVTQGDTNADI